MKINEVEELVGITKKNIRFYEDMGLLNPARNPSNSYRDYGEEDVVRLQKIKLLRKLDIPCEQIKKLMEGRISFTECILAQEKLLEKQSHNLMHIQDICSQLSKEEITVENLDASAWLKKVGELEKGGVEFVNTREKDIKERRWGSIASALFFVLVMLAVLTLIIYGNKQDPLPLGLFVVLLSVPSVSIVCTLVALGMRIKEIKKGEVYEAGNY